MKCPYCAEEIAEGAKKCKHCGERLEKELREEKRLENNNIGYEIKYKNFTPTPYVRCPSCGYKGKARQTAKGNILIEVILWLFLIVPGVIYSLWRSSNRYYVCPKCGNDKLQKTEKPKTEKTIETNEVETAEQGLKSEIKKVLKMLGYIFLGIIALFVIIGIFGSDDTDTTSVEQNTNQEVKQEIKTYTDLNEAYNAHKNFIWNVTQEGVKLISTNQAHKFEGPTYAGTTDGENFLIEGDDNGRHFACVFKKANNERGMEIYNCVRVE